jgi:hypothetical protein
MTAPPLTWSIDAHAAHAPAAYSYEANAKELDALKRYAQVEGVASFKARVKVAPLSGGRFKATGTLEASVIQASVVDLDAVPASIEENFAVEFWPEEAIDGREETAVSLESEPPEPIVDGLLLIGAFLCELFSVSLDPYPRNPDDAFEWAPGESEPSISPFADLAQLRRKKPDSG